MKIDFKYIFGLAIIFLMPFLTSAQQIRVEQSISDTEYPEITWYMAGKADSTVMRVMRADLEHKVFSTIQTTHFVRIEEDTTRFWIMDTTLMEKGLYLYKITTMVGSEEIESEPAFGHNFGMLPKPYLANFAATPAEDRKAIHLEWELNYFQTVSSLSLYRSRSYDTGYVKVAELSPEMKAYTDVVPLANEAWFYFLLIHDYFGNQLPGVRVPAFATFSEKPVRPVNFKGVVQADSVFLSWQNAGKNVVGFRVYRAIDGKDFRLLGEMVQDKSEQQSMADTGPSVAACKEVHYFVKLVSDGYVEGESSDTLGFYFPYHEKLLPPADLTVLKLPDGRLKLCWDESEQTGCMGYHIYLLDEEGSEQRINSELVRLNCFEDTIFRDEGKYLYAVESVGLYETVSERRSKITVYHSMPRLHVILDLKLKKEGIMVSWATPMFPSLATIKLFRFDDTGKSKLLKTFQKEDVSYLDKKLEKGTLYHYSLMGVLDNGQELILNEGVELIY